MFKIDRSIQKETQETGQLKTVMDSELVYTLGWIQGRISACDATLVEMERKRFLSYLHYVKLVSSVVFPLTQDLVQ